MSTRKKRSLSGVVVNNSNENETPNNILLPATSRALTQGKNNQSEAVRGTEFLVEPSDCKPWKYHNRDNIWMSVDKCQDLISSIRKNGQKVPIFARKIENDSEGKNWEIIAGRRRWYACNYLGIKIRVKATDATDRECAILMNLENKDRNDISEFEDAISFKRQLEANLFDSQDEMALSLDLKKSKLSKMLSASKIINYPEIMVLFKDLTLIKINPIYSLVVLLEKNATFKNQILERAVELNAKLASRESVKASVIINELMSSVSKSSTLNKAPLKSYKINNTLVIKENEVTSKKVVLEISRENLSGLPREKLFDLVMQAISGYI